MSKYTQQGASLIEVLVSAIILSVGLLGMAGLQVEGMKKRKESELKTLAAIEANDIVDRMRANLVAAENAQYDMTQANPAINSGCLGGGTCTPVQMAQTDLQEWLDRLSQSLPNGNGYVCITSNPGAIGTALNCNGAGDFYVISINWTNQQGKDNEFRMSFRP